MAFWVHVPDTVASETWTPPAPLAIPHKGFPALRVEAGEHELVFTSPAQLAHCIDVLAKPALGRGRVHIVKPTGAFEDDPNVTDKNFPGNPTRSYCSREPLRVVGELETWEHFDAEYFRQLGDCVRLGMGEIIN